MTQNDISGILMTYSEKTRKARDKKHLIQIIKDLKTEFDLRKVEFTDMKKEENEFQ